MSAEEPSQSDGDSDFGEWENLTISAITEYKPIVNSKEIVGVDNDREGQDGQQEYLVRYKDSNETEWVPATAFTSPEFLLSYQKAKEIKAMRDQYQRTKDLIKSRLSDRPDLLQETVTPIPEGTEPNSPEPREPEEPVATEPSAADELNDAEPEPEPELPAVPPIRAPQAMSRESSGTERAYRSDLTNSVIGSDMVVVGCGSAAMSVNSSLLRSDDSQGSQPSVTASQFIKAELEEAEQAERQREIREEGPLSLDAQLSGAGSPSKLAPAPDSPLPSLAPSLRSLNERHSQGGATPPGSPGHSPRGVQRESMLTMTQSLMEEKEDSPEKRANVISVPQIPEGPKLNDGDWRCPTCTFLNQYGHERCQMCGGARPASVKAPYEGLPGGAPYEEPPKVSKLPAVPIEPPQEPPSELIRTVVPLDNPEPPAPPPVEPHRQPVEPPRPKPVEAPKPPPPETMPKGWQQRWDCCEKRSYYFEESTKRCYWDKPLAGQWACGTCTYINKEANADCEMCRSKKPMPKDLRPEKPPALMKMLSDVGTSLGTGIMNLGSSVVDAIGLKPSPRRAQELGLANTKPPKLAPLPPTAERPSPAPLPPPPALPAAAEASNAAPPPARAAPRPDSYKMVPRQLSVPATAAERASPVVMSVLAKDLLERLNAAHVIMHNENSLTSAKFDLTRDEIGLVADLLNNYVRSNPGRQVSPRDARRALMQKLVQDEAPCRPPALPRKRSTDIANLQAKAVGKELELDEGHDGARGSIGDEKEDLGMSQWTNVPAEPAQEEPREPVPLKGTNALVVKGCMDQSVSYAQGHPYEAFWRIENSSEEETLSFEYQLHHLSGNTMGVEVDENGMSEQDPELGGFGQRSMEPPYTSQQTLAPGESFDFKLMLTMPTDKVPRRFYDTMWQLKTPEGSPVGPPLALKLEVKHYTKEQETMVRNLVAMGFSRKDVVTLLEARRYSGDLSVHAVALCQGPK